MITKTPWKINTELTLKRGLFYKSRDWIVVGKKKLTENKIM